MLPGNDAPWPPPVTGEAAGPARLTVVDEFNEFRVTVHADDDGWHLNWVDHARGYHTLELGFGTWAHAVLDWADRSLATAASAAWQPDRSFLMRFVFPGTASVLDVRLVDGRSEWTWVSPPAGGLAPYNLAA